MIDRNAAMKLWRDVFGDVKWIQDCFGTWMYKDAWSNEQVVLLRPGQTTEFDYSWNVDHIRPKASFENEKNCEFYNNYEPMHRTNNLKKKDNYPKFKIDDREFEVFQIDEDSGYGIIELSTNKKIDWKSRTGKKYL